MCIDPLLYTHVTHDKQLTKKQKISWNSSEWKLVLGYLTPDTHLVNNIEPRLVALSPSNPFRDIATTDPQQ